MTQQEFMILGNLLGTSTLFAVFLYLYKRERARALLLWTLAWLFRILHFVVGVAVSGSFQQPVIVELGLTSSLLHALLIYLGLRAFIDKPIQRRTLLLPAGIGVLTLVTSLSGLPFFFAAVPVYLYQAGVFILTGVTFFRARDILGAGGGITGVTFVLWGLHKLDYPLLYDHEILAPVGFVVAMVFELLSAFGILIAYLEKERYNAGVSERRHRLLAENAQDVIYRLRLVPEPEFEYISPSVARVTGYSPEDYHQNPQLILRTVHPEDRSRLDDILRDGVQAGEPVVVRWLTAVGETVWTEHVHTPEYDQNGRVVGIEGIARDITERKLAEFALQESEKRYRDIFENTQVAMMILDPSSGHILNANPAARAFYRRDDLGRLRLHDLAEEPEHLVDKGIASILQSSEAFVSSRHRVGDGSVRDVEIFAGRMELHAGQALFAVIYDATERRRAESERRLLAEVVHQIMDALLIVNHQGKLLYVNPAAESMLGRSFGELYGGDAKEIVRNRLGDEASRTVWQAASKGLPWKGRLPVPGPEGKRGELEISLYPVRDEMGSISHQVFLARDVSREQQLEFQLRHAQKMEAIGRLAGGIAHDFNNILNGIFGYSDLVMIREDLPEGVREDVGEIMNAAVRAGDLVSQILTISRREEKQFQPTRIEPVIREVARLMRGSLPATISVETRVDDSCDAIMGDSVQLHQVLMNLCTNAQHAMANRGTLTLSLHKEKISASEAEKIPTLTAGDHCVLEVQDTGRGIPPDIQQRMFEPYFTTKVKGEGTGLGLAMVDAIVKGHNGAIQVNSREGEGTQFRLFFPTIERRAWDSRPSGEKSHVPKGGDEHILLVDDEAAILGTLQRFLQQLGYRVTTAGSAEDALGILEGNDNDIDVLVTDLTMPGTSGADLIRDLRERQVRIPALLLSGYNDQLNGAELARLGIHDFLQKPLRMHRLADALRSALGGDGSGGDA